MNPSLKALLDSAPPYPERIVCLTEEPTETLYRIGAGDRVVGVSGYTHRPPEARCKRWCRFEDRAGEWNI